MDTGGIVGWLAGGGLIVVVVQAIKFFGWLDNFSKVARRWLIYGLAFVSTIIVTLVSNSISTLSWEAFMLLMATFGEAETLYRLMWGKLFGTE